MKKCDLSSMPKRLFNNKEIYDWKGSSGLIIPFEYEGVKSQFKIIEYVPHDKVKVLSDNGIHIIRVQNIKEGTVGFLLKPTDKFKWIYEVGDIIQDTVRNHKRHLKITKRKYMDENRIRAVDIKYYQYKCLICGYDCEMDDYWIGESAFRNMKRGCPCCSSNKIIKGINDISTTFLEAMKYIDDPEYAYTHAKTSRIKTNMTCPICGFKKTMPVGKLYYQSFGCPRCSDGFSYPEKFFFNILEQTNTNFKYQLTGTDFDWCGKYRYDFYLPDHNCIVEVHGKQHYEPVWKGFKEQQKIDKAKRELALKNNISSYIELDCRESNKDHIKQSLIKSNMPFDVTNIDYDQADVAGQTNKLFQACKLYKEHPDMYIKDIAALLNVTTSSIVHYLKKGRGIGLCEYRDERRSKGKEVLKLRSKRRQ